MAGYFKAVKGEFKKIIWPDKSRVAKQTAAVVVVSICLGVLIGLIDKAIQYGLSLII